MANIPDARRARALRRHAGNPSLAQPAAANRAVRNSPPRPHHPVQSARRAQSKLPRGAARRRRRRAVLAVLAAVAFLSVLALLARDLTAFTAPRDFETDNLPWNLTLVNSTHPLPDDFTVSTVELSNGQRVDERIAQPLEELFHAASTAGYTPCVSSGFRTRDDQEQILEDRIESYEADGLAPQAAEREARRWVAEPGTSEHELGLAVDINDALGNEGLYDWLAEHAHEYGFIQRYPSDKTDITGISFEPWHYRYVGVEDATAIWQSGITLEEYLART